MSTKRERVRRLEAQRQPSAVERREKPLSDIKSYDELREEIKNNYDFDPGPLPDPLAEPPKAKRYDGTEKLIAKFKAGQKPEIREILRELAIAKNFHLSFYADKPEAAIPVELIDIIATAIAPSAKWARAQATAKKRTASERRARWRHDADQKRLERPNLSDKRIAEIIAKPGEKPNTIRRQITKSGK
jgi:hypothetical protein